MKWEQLLSTKRSRESGVRRQSFQNTDLRSEFEKDYHRIIGSASFRRLQDKTQVFPLDKSDFIRTRLTHSMEVSSIARSLGQNVAESILLQKKDEEFEPHMKEDICNILQCAGLIHDIGNPPFGHYGEVAIREWFTRNLPKLTFHGKKISEILDEQMLADLYHFEGNAQALRLVTKLHFLVDEHGMNLTYALLNTIVKYPIPSHQMDPTSDDITKKKMGYYYADEEIFRKIEKETGTNGRRHPLTYILEAADDIAYKTADIEDAFIKKFISYYKLLEELKEVQKHCDSSQEGVFLPADCLEELYRRGKENNVSHPEAYAIKNWIVRVQGFLISCATYGFTSNYDEIMAGEYTHDLFWHTDAEQLMDMLGSLAYEEVFISDTIYRMEVAEEAVLDFLMDKFMHAIISYDDEPERLESLDVRMVSFISSNYKKAYHVQAEGKSDVEKLYLRLLLVTDYICGMTDSYAKRLYQELNAMDWPWSGTL